MNNFSRFYSISPLIFRLYWSQSDVTYPKAFLEKWTIQQKIIFQFQLVVPKINQKQKNLRVQTNKQSKKLFSFIIISRYRSIDQTYFGFSSTSEYSRRTTEGSEAYSIDSSLINMTRPDLRGKKEKWKYIFKSNFCPQT